MVNVGGKPSSLRRAVASGLLIITPQHRAALGNLSKGDALTVAQIAGIMAGKRTAEWIPLCHSLALNVLDVTISIQPEGLFIEAIAEADGVTGVEMEVFVAVAAAGVTLIDMLKSVGSDLTLTNIRLEEKTGGKAPWKRAQVS